MNTLMDDIRAFGRVPRLTKKPRRRENTNEAKRKDTNEDEHLLAERLRDAKRHRHLSEEQLAELAAMEPLPELEAEPEPLGPFSSDAANRLEQDVLMARNGFRNRRVMNRLQRYKKYMSRPGAAGLEAVQTYKDVVVQAVACSSAAAPYVPGADIQGDSLRSFQWSPLSLVLWCANSAVTPPSRTTLILRHTRITSMAGRASTASECCSSWSVPGVGPSLPRRRGS